MRETVYWPERVVRRATAGGPPADCHDMRFPRYTPLTIDVARSTVAAMSPDKFASHVRAVDSMCAAHLAVLGRYADGLLCRMADVCRLETQRVPSVDRAYWLDAAYRSNLVDMFENALYAYFILVEIFEFDGGWEKHVYLVSKLNHTAVMYYRQLEDYAAGFLARVMFLTGGDERTLRDFRAGTVEAAMTRALEAEISALGRPSTELVRDLAELDQDTSRIYAKQAVVRADALARCVVAQNPAPVSVRAVLAVVESDEFGGIYFS